MNRLQAKRRQTRISAAAVLLAAGAFAASSVARAEFPFPPTPRELHHDVRSLVHDVLRTLDRIPVEIHGGYVGNLEPFLVGNLYYGPHRHNHATYSFPVWIDGSVDYRPYVYCNSRLYGSYDSRPQFWSGWGVESQGHWCGHHHAYYPSVHACFRPQVRQSYGNGYGYGSGHRSDDRSDYRYGNGSNYRPQYHSNHGSGYRPSERSHQGSHSGSHNEWRNDSRHGSGNGSQNGSGYGSHNGSRNGSYNGTHSGSRTRSNNGSRNRSDSHQRHDGDSRQNGGQNRH